MENIISTLHQNLLNTSYIEIIAVFFGLISVWFARNENIWVFPTGLINVALYVYIFLNAKYYANMGINFYFVIMSIYGWYNWIRKDKDERQIHISRSNRKEYLISSGLFLISFIVLFFVLKTQTDSKLPVLDSFTSSLYIVAMWLQTNKKLENWTFWIIADLLIIPLLFYQGLIFSGFQYFIFLIIAISGYFEWRKKLKII
ncbi:MAG: nicotinamide mononucleotide transporter [Bacteroidetes bacterium]|nr:nicotinamide mononucleotide transporter [Bacteroidota bacterium]